MKTHQRIVIGALLFVLTLPNLSGCSRINEDYSLSECRHFCGQPVCYYGQ